MVSTCLIFRHKSRPKAAEHCKKAMRSLIETIRNAHKGNTFFPISKVLERIEMRKIHILTAEIAENLQNLRLKQLKTDF